MEYLVKLGKSSEANEQEIFVNYMERRNLLVVANVNENMWSGIIRSLIKPLDKAMRVIYTLERKARKLGKRKGIPDIFIPQPHGKYHGMYIEFKYGKNKATKEQMDWLQRLTKQGYYCVICYSALQAIQAYQKYEGRK